MTAQLARHLRYLAIALALIAWAAAAHYTSALVEASSWGAALGLAPFVAVAAAFAWRSSHRGPALALLAAMVAGLAALWPQLERNIGWMYFIQHMGTNTLLCLAFGRTLAAGREPLCTRLAAVVHGTTSPAVARYTRQVTLAWTVFFGVLAGLSATLFFFAARELWSVLANLLTLPLVALMFAAEYAVRVRVLPPEDRGGIIASIRAYWQPSPTPAQPSSEAHS